MIAVVVVLWCSRCGSHTHLHAEGSPAADAPEGMTVVRAHLTDASTVAQRLFMAAHEGPFTLGGEC